MDEDIDDIFRRQAAEDSRRQAEQQQYEESRKKWDALNALLSQIEHFSSNQLRNELDREPTESEIHAWYADLLIQYCRAVREADLAAALPNLTPARDGTRLGLAVVRYAWVGNSKDIVSILHRAEGVKDRWLGAGMVSAIIDLLHRLRGTRAPTSGGWAEIGSADADTAEGTGAGSDPTAVGRDGVPSPSALSRPAGPSPKGKKMPDSDASRSAEQSQLQIARNLFAILETADFYWGLATDVPTYNHVPADERCSLAQEAYEILKENIDCLSEANYEAWTDLNVWRFVERFADLLQRHTNENLPWETVWNRVREDIKQWEPAPDFGHFRREIEGNRERLVGGGRVVLAPAALCGTADTNPAEVEQAEEAGPVPKGRRAPSGLEIVHTLPELREWLKVRLRWLRDWHMAPRDPKPIPPPFLNAIISLYGESLCPPPNDLAKMHEWANQMIMRFSIHTVHEVHDWLETHDIFGAPDCPSLDPIRDERILVSTLEHLSRLLNFIGVRAGEQSTPAGQAEGEQTEGIAQRKRKRRGGKRRLEVRNPLLFQVYDHIRREHRPGEVHRDTLDRLKADKQFVEQIKEAGKKPTSALVKNALDFFDRRQRRSLADNRQSKSD